MLMSTRLKDKLPATAKLLEPSVTETAKHDLEKRQRQQKSCYDRHTKLRADFEVGEPVRVRLSETWEPAHVTVKHDAPRSYTVAMEDGRSYRRNKNVINKRKD